VKIVAVTGETKLLVEVNTYELREITEYNWKPGYLSCNDIQLRQFKPGDEIDLPKVFKEAKELLSSFRGIAPALRQSAKRLEHLASEVEIHEPNHTLLPKKADA
jgi:hypothetical protein